MANDMDKAVNVSYFVEQGSSVNGGIIRPKTLLLLVN